MKAKQVQALEDVVAMPLAVHEFDGVHYVPLSTVKAMCDIAAGALPITRKKRSTRPVPRRRPMIQLDRRAEGAGQREVKFALQVKPLDQYHTHGELERCDKEAVMAALAKCASEIVEILKRVPPKPS